uniref:Uncharacterized protein n=1 Tax=Cyanothece sp. (strain PCC 7425 / ATCC 29141) TaxID=395961 RepID=B8HTB9_CYAP4
MRFLTLHWPKISVMVIFYGLIALSISTFTNAQLDAMQHQVNGPQFVNYSSN